MEIEIATAIVGNYMNVLVAHIGGGDPVYGNADDPIRFADSKLAHIHCCAAKEYANNLLQTRKKNLGSFLPAIQLMLILIALSTFLNQQSKNSWELQPAII